VPLGVGREVELGEDAVDVLADGAFGDDEPLGDTPRSAVTGLVPPYTFVTDTSRSASPRRRRGRSAAGRASSADLAVMSCSSRHVQPACGAAQHQR
jgi:hypothetical protein